MDFFRQTAYSRADISFSNNIIYIPYLENIIISLIGKMILV